jgi:hypothetical protein
VDEDDGFSWSPLVHETLPLDPMDAWENDNYFAAAGGVARPATRAPSFWDAPARPLRYAGTLAGLGLLGVLFAEADLLRHLVVVAPVFEELLKFGVALFLVTAMHLRARWLRALVALAPGALFGLVEHATTYADEDAARWALRVAFHAASTALSMAVWSAVEPLPTWRHRWLSTLPSTLLHALNNAFAVTVAVVVLVSGSEDAIGAFAFAVQAALVSLMALAALATLATPALARALVAARARSAWFDARVT